MLKYHEVYRVETEEPRLQYLALTGAAAVEEGRWVFWRWRNGAFEDPTIAFRVLKQTDASNGTVDTVIQLGDMAIAARFVPVTVDYMIAHADTYGITPDFIPTLTLPGMREAYFSMDVSEEYNQQFEPAADDDVYAEQCSTPTVGKLKVEEGCFYEAQKDGSWKKLDWFP